MNKNRQQQLGTYLLATIESPYTMWVFINIIVWSLGLYVIALSIRFLGLVGAPIGTALAGIIIGGGQAWALRHLLPIDPRRWIQHSVIGTILGVLPIGLLFLWILLVAIIGLNSVLFILGGIFGGTLGGIQSRLLQPIIHEQIGWWIVINVIAGAVCAPLSLTGTTFWLPVFCSLGPLSFGLLTAGMLRYILRHLDVPLNDAT